MGTHIDSPLHLDPKSNEDAAALELMRCCGEAVILDVRTAAEVHGVITVADLDEAEQGVESPIGVGAIILLHTGHSAKYVASGIGGRSEWAASHVGVEPDAVGWFLERRVKMVGIDSPNVDCDNVLTAHLNFSLRGWVGESTILIVENLINLDRVEATKCWFMALPLPIVGGSGSPVRAIALVHK